MGAAFSANMVTALRQVKVVELKDKITEQQKLNNCFYVICADMAKDGSAETAVGVAKVIPKEHYFSFKFVNLLTIPSTDYMVIANAFKKLVLTNLKQNNTSLDICQVLFSRITYREQPGAATLSGNDEQG